MAIITFTTDWSQEDLYAGLLKGRLKTVLPEVELVDISQSVKPFHGSQAAFVLRQVFREFPTGTIHLFLVNQGHDLHNFPVIIRSHHSWLIGWNDGLIDLALDKKPDYLLPLTNDSMSVLKEIWPEYFVNFTLKPSFPELFFFPLMVKYILSGESLEHLGSDQSEFYRDRMIQPTVQKDGINGQILFTDGYGNAISNISSELFAEIGRERKFELIIQSNHYKLNEIKNSYMESDPGDLLALFNSSGLLEVAINLGPAADLMGLEVGSIIKIQFYE